jgi:hypothetical protein
MDQTKLCINGQAIIQMHLFSHMCTSKTELGTLEWEYQEQEPPFGGKHKLILL